MWRFDSTDLPTAEGNERWFLAHTRPRCELKAEFHLRAQGFRTYLPQIRKTVRHARQLREARAPLFPSYLFLVLDLGRDRWLSVRSTIGVSSLVTCNERPIPVPVGVVESLIERSDHNVIRLETGSSKGSPCASFPAPSPTSSGRWSAWMTPDGCGSFSK